MRTSRREFLSAGAAIIGSAGGAHAQAESTRERQVHGTVDAFPLTHVRLTEGPFHQAQESNRRLLHKLPSDRLLHNFRVNAGLPSAAQPLGGWERPDCELRGHFTGHYLSAAALMYSSTGDADLKSKANGMVAELAKCQSALGNGYLSAFPLEYWDRLKARKPVWAPFYTLHKIMAGLLEVHQHLGNEQALEVLKGVADWVDRWSGPIPKEQMQDILNTEFGGMNEVLYNLWGLTGNDQYARVAHRFDHVRIYEPLRAHRDQLKGLHANTNVPKIIGAARRYELSQQSDYRDLAEFFWHAVTSGHTYCTGGTSNGELWKTDARHLAEELAMERETNECCVAYNMLKLTQHLYSWNPQPSYFDYYERTLFNHRLGTIDPTTAATMYFLPLRAGAWKVFNSEWDSFWCCTGTGVEEHSKLNGGIFWHGNGGVYVNLFIASELNAPETGLRLRQQTRFPEGDRTVLVVDKAPSKEMALRIRVPAWTAAGGSATLNGRKLETFAEPGSYVTIQRLWRDGDRVEVRFPMELRSEPMPDDPGLTAVLYGPLVMAAEMGTRPISPYQKDQGLQAQPIMETPEVAFSSIAPSGPLRFRSSGPDPMQFAPLYQVMDQRYSPYVRLSDV